jgi:hypothetical protein
MPGKRKRASNDAQWCLNNSNTRTIKNFAIEFGLTDRQYTVTRYRNILSAHFSRDRRENILQDLDKWKKSLDAKIFWKEQARKQTIAETRVRCSAFVDTIIHEEGPQELSMKLLRKRKPPERPNWSYSHWRLPWKVVIKQA